ncbi:uncharacterized protein BKA78DRAFT_316672 [Phyllosticta capitalensis]|uniref:uncharacterized protein n=1 Tax=Phyllosticta capitalensis TaxID=121624 RepID=UPI003130A3D6
MTTGSAQGYRNREIRRVAWTNDVGVLGTSNIMIISFKYWNHCPNRCRGHLRGTPESKGS